MTLSPAQHQREYGHDHTRLRKQLAPLVAAGQFSCAKCGKQIERGEGWDLGHSPDRRGRAPEHRKCNRSTVGLRERRRNELGEFSGRATVSCRRVRFGGRDPLVAGVVS
jgi:hypothetical protein